MNNINRDYVPKCLDNFFTDYYNSVCNWRNNLLYKDHSKYEYKSSYDDLLIGPSVGKRIVTAFALLSMPLVAIAQLIVSIFLALIFLPELCINPEMYRRCRLTPLIDVGLVSLVVWIAVPKLLIENFSSKRMDLNW